MALRLPNRTLETSVSTGTGNFTLAGAFLGFMAFAASVAVGDTVHYQIVGVDNVARPTGEWEIGRGTISAAGVLQRDTVIWNHLNTLAKVDFSAGTKHVGATVLSPSLPDSNEAVQFDWQTALALDVAGQVAFFAGSAPPPGWLKANGAAISRTTYARLFARIGTTYGVGDGTNTFNLPDARGEFLRAWDDGRTLDNGRTLGSVQGGLLLSHAHGLNDPGHAHGVADPGHAHGAYTDAQGQHQHGFVAPQVSGFGTGSSGFFGRLVDGDIGKATDGAGNHAHNVGIYGAGTGIGIYAAGTGQSVQAAGGTENRPRNLALSCFIRY